MKKKGDSWKRSVIKAISWRVIATMATIALVYALTENINISLIAGGGDIIIKLILYYFHERVWNGINWGRRA